MVVLISDLHELYYGKPIDIKLDGIFCNEKDADIVIMLMRPEYYEMTEPVEIKGKEYSTEGLLICKVEKNRHGITTNIPLRFIGETVTIQNHTIWQTNYKNISY